MPLSSAVIYWQETASETDWSGHKLAHLQSRGGNDMQTAILETREQKSSPPALHGLKVRSLANKLERLSRSHTFPEMTRHD